MTLIIKIYTKILETNPNFTIINIIIIQKVVYKKYTITFNNNNSYQKKGLYVYKGEVYKEDY